MKAFKRYQTLRTLRGHPIPDRLWREVSDRLVLLRGLDSADKARLRILTTLFIHDKQFNGVQGMVITPDVPVTIAAQACVEVLELGLDAFAGWVEIIVYPAAFRTRHETTDANGLVSDDEHVLSGEAWSRGPVILSWTDVVHDSFSPRPGSNVVLHEFAHKLDALNGRTNGMPPLHPDMPIQAWTDALSEAYALLVAHVEQGRGTVIDAYGASSPAEFFAVVSEYFFTAPEVLRQHAPAVYGQLRAWYRQDPVARVVH